MLRSSPTVIKGNKLEVAKNERVFNSVVNNLCFPFNKSKECSIFCPKLITLAQKYLFVILFYSKFICAVVFCSVLVFGSHDRIMKN